MLNTMASPRSQELLQVYVATGAWQRLSYAVQLSWGAAYKPVRRLLDPLYPLFSLKERALFRLFLLNMCGLEGRTRRQRAGAARPRLESRRLLLSPTPPQPKDAVRGCECSAAP